MQDDPALSAATAAVGLHYPLSIYPAGPAGGSDAGATYYRNLSTHLPGGQKLWASEEYSTYSDSNGGRCLAKLLNRNYVDGEGSDSTRVCCSTHAVMLSCCHAVMLSCCHAVVLSVCVRCNPTLCCEGLAWPLTPATPLPLPPSHYQAH
jgi:hypothetical protein